MNVDFESSRRASFMPLSPHRIVVLCCAVLCGYAPVSAQSGDSTVVADSSTGGRLFYRPDLGYGSEQTISPLSVLLNRGFSNLFFTDIERRPHKIDWGSGLSTVYRAVTDPGPTIRRRGGWEAFINDEFLPGSGSVWTFGWSANYVGHVVGGGITFRYLREWYEHQGAGHPGFMAGAFLMGTMVVNEVVEARASTVPSAGTVADLLFFDPLGILVFSHDGVARFFANTLRAADWSPQAALTLPDGRLLNNSQVLAYKAPLPITDRLRLLMVIGLAAQTGLTYEFSDGYSIGAAAGFHAAARRVDPITQEESIVPAVGAGLYFDRHDSLLGSLVFEPKAFARVRANVFPGFLDGPLRHLGLWLTVNQGDEVSFGLSMYRGVGMGLGHSVGG